MAKRAVAVLASAWLVLAAANAVADGVKCTMRFTLKGTSMFYKKADGQGTITCNNGESAGVKITVRGGGLTFGKTEIQEGEGKFSAVTGIDQIFGAYVAAEAQAGAGKAAQAAAYTKGDISLALTGKGQGKTLGFAFGKLELTRTGP